MLRPNAPAVIFDLDGVLIDSRRAISACINHALEAAGEAGHVPSSLYSYIGPPLAVAFSELLVEPVESERVAACVDAYRARYAVVSLHETEAVPGIHTALCDLARSYRLAVATSKPLVFARPLLDALGLGELFVAVAGPDLASRTQDKATAVGDALRALKTADAVMVGDRSFDVFGARAHGLSTVGVTWGIGTREELLSAGAALVVDDPQLLSQAVRNLLNGAGRLSY